MLCDIFEVEVSWTGLSAGFTSGYAHESSSRTSLLAKTTQRAPTVLEEDALA